jgi:hypothetical protein
MTRKHPQKVLRLLLLVAFLLLICVEGFHYHQDNVSHADCPLCVAAHQAAVVSHHTCSLVVSHDVRVTLCDCVPELISLEDRSSSLVRGPPA